MVYKWPKSAWSFGGHKHVNPSIFVKKLGSPDLMIHCDIQDCFPSITSKMAMGAIRRHTNIGNDADGEALKKDILQGAFVKLPAGMGDFLAQGPNISPLICNCVLFEIDISALALVRETYTFLQTRLNLITSFYESQATRNSISGSVNSAIPEEIGAYMESCAGHAIRYSRYIDNIGVFFWNFKDSYKDLREARKIDKKYQTTICEQYVKAYMSAREFLWQHLNIIITNKGFALNPKKTRFRRPGGRKPMRFVGYTLNSRPRPSKHYIETLRAKLHNFEMYLKSLILDSLIQPTIDLRWIEKIKGQCTWVFTADPLNRRLVKCIRNIIALENRALGTRHFASLKKYLGLKL
jgi:hypothetical protein